MDAPIASSAQSPSMDQSATGSATDAAEATAKDRQVEASKKRSSLNGPPQPVKKTKHIALSTESLLSLWQATTCASASIRAGARDPSGGTTMYQTCVCCGQVPCVRSVRKTRGGIFQTWVYFTFSEFVGKRKKNNALFYGQR
ncbi:unnamed protein product [Chondrus crispus]|uniref:Uncharacterized protein n=1 Tax=Chondrus crispus TaxID=2769 RepID=R7QE25_CHOCR|nr:unnamed protein product [Chondrus crispus]CDF36772.1 unnamed protein product [Chondrus crispus]|eukprot:XP_005716591.1 unnamed protein product [Chondrus crispus]